MSQATYPVIAVIGPTGSGKTALVHKICGLLNGEIIAADSVTVYQKLNIFSNKPTPVEQKTYPYHLLNIIPPDRQYSAGQFMRDASRAVKAIVARQKVPLICGGTPLYVKAFFYGLIDAPIISPEIKKCILNMQLSYGLAGCYTELKKRDPGTAERLNPNDTQRILRALELVLSGHQSITDYQRDHGFTDTRFDPVYLMPDTARETVYENINRRTEEMLQAGGIEETRKLLAEGYAPDCPGLRCIGYAQAVRYISGKMTRSEMTADIATKTRRYAKRQLTWYRNYPNIRTVSPTADLKTLKQMLADVIPA